MLYTRIVLISLAATASAIDIYMQWGDNCDGPSTICNGINPNVCCTVSGSKTVGFRGIPTDWVIETQVFGGDPGSGCNNFRGREVVRNSNFICMRDRFVQSLTGAQYFFTNKKRYMPGEACQKPDMLELEDGTRYSIEGLDEGVVSEL